MGKIAKYLNQNIAGDVYDNENVLEAFATDKSVLKIKPQAVAAPRSTRDIRKLMRFADQLAEKGMKLGVTVRGNGNDKTGAAIGSGLVVSMGAEMNQILEIDSKQKLVRCQPGVTLKELNSVLAMHGLVIPVDPKYSGHTVGGIIGNELSGRLDARYGGVAQYMNQVEVVLANGDVVQFDSLSKHELNKKKGKQDFEGEIYRRLESLIEDRQDVIKEFLHAEDTDKAGYENIVKVRGNDGSFDLRPLLLASQGTLAVITELILSTEYISQEENYVLLEFANVDEARDIIDLALPMRPIVLNVYEREMLNDVAKTGKTLRLLEIEDEVRTGVVLLIGFGENHKRLADKKIKNIVKALPKEKAECVVMNDENEEDFAAFLKLESTYLNDASKGVRLPVVDGAMVPTQFLGEYFSSVHGLEKKLGIRLSIYGSVLNEIYNIRPGLNLSVLGDRQMVFRLLKEYSKILDGLKGTLTGASAEGRLKAPFMSVDEDERLVDLYEHIKEIFDPNGILNPGVKLKADLKDITGALRTSYDEGIIQE